MSHNIIKWPSLKDRAETAQYFMQKHGFPNVVGAVDGTHIIIDPPKKNKDDYLNRKGKISICVQGICNEQKHFTDIFIGFPGSVHDSRVLRNSPIFAQLAELGEQGQFLLGDSAYPCLVFLMVSYRDNGHLTRAQKHFNLSLSKIRVAIEHTFGILKQRFRQLYYCRLKDIEILCHFIRACCVLHNLSNESDLEAFTGEATIDEDDETMEYQGQDENGRALRDEICREMFENK